MNHQVLEIYSAALVFFLQLWQKSHPIQTPWGHTWLFSMPDIETPSVRTFRGPSPQRINGNVLFTGPLFRFDRSTKIQQTCLVDPQFIGPILGCRQNSLLLPALVFCETKSRLQPLKQFSNPWDKINTEISSRAAHCSGIQSSQSFLEP